MDATATLNVGRCKVTCSKNECYNGQRRGLAGRTMDGPVPKSPHSRRATPREEDVFGGRTKSGTMAASVEEHLNHAGMGRWQVGPVKKHLRGRPPVDSNPRSLALFWRWRMLCSSSTFHPALAAHKRPATRTFQLPSPSHTATAARYH